MSIKIQETTKWYAVARSSKTGNMRFKVKHETQEKAEAEASRLATQTPECKADAYYIIECVGKVYSPKVIKVANG